MISSNFNWSQGQADLLRRAARCAPLRGATGKTAFYERGCLLIILSPLFLTPQKQLMDCASVLGRHLAE